MVYDVTARADVPNTVSHHPQWLHKPRFALVFSNREDTEAMW